MNESEAIALYRSGEQATVGVLLEQDAQIRNYQNRLALAKDHPSTPSGQKPVYAKPAGGHRRKTPGRKDGHPGSRRPPPDHVDETLPHPLTRCPDCRTPLPEASETRTRYTEEIPPVQPKITLHLIHRYWCSVCDRFVEAPFTAALPRSPIGLGTLIYSAWLHYALGLTLNKIVELLNVSAHFTITPGGLSQAWARLARILQPLYDQIAAQARSSSVLHADETGWRVNGLTHWLWCFTHKTLVYYVIDRCRGSPVVKKVLGDFFAGTLITDFFGAYNLIQVWKRQMCLVHLLRELARVDLIHTAAAWSRFRNTLKGLLKDAFRLARQRASLSPEARARKKSRLQARLQCLATCASTDKHARRLAKRLRRYQDALLTFLDDPEVPPDNNHAERQTRPGVLCRKNSFGNRSQQGALTQALFMSLFRTLSLRHHHPVQSLQSLIESYLKTGNLPALPS